MPRINRNAKDGTLFANAFYTTDDLVAKGYGHAFLTDARLAGVPVKQVGRRSGYFGDDLMKYIRTLDKYPFSIAQKIEEIELQRRNEAARRALKERHGI
jgi:hypothetical protein